MNDIVFHALRPQPLARYLTALGAFRALAREGGPDPAARGYWGEDGFHVLTRLGREEIIHFFLERYAPSPIVSPWNGGSGFFRRASGQETETNRAVGAIEAGDEPRLAALREAITRARQVLQDLGLTAKPEKGAKEELFLALRAALPDEAVLWLDAVAVWTDEGLRFNPLLGTGGNDGNLDWAGNYAIQVARLIPPRAGSPRPAAARAWLEDALWGAETPPLDDGAIGQFDPAGVGGLNQGTGFEGRGYVNPWSFVLMMEGTLFFAGATSRRLSPASRPMAAFPFSVDPSLDRGDVAEEEQSNEERAEIWLPVWDRPAGFAETAHFFAQGRARWGRRNALRGVDFVRAVRSLGVDRGARSFHRYVFAVRNGRNYFAVHRDEVAVRRLEPVHLLHALDPWLDRLREVSERRGAPAEWREALRRVEEAVYQYSAGRTGLAAVMAAAGRAERTLARTPQAAREAGILPLAACWRRGAGLHTLQQWIAAVDDGSHEVALALALSSLGARPARTGGVDAGGRPAGAPVREYLEPLDTGAGGVSWAPSSRRAVWGPGPLPANLVRVLDRRWLDAMTETPDTPAAAWIYGAGRGAALETVAAFLDEAVDEDLVTDLLHGFAALPWETVERAGRTRQGGDAPTDPARGRREGAAWPAAAPLFRHYAVFRSLLSERGLPAEEGDEVQPRVDRSLLALVAAGRLREAYLAAFHALQAAGVSTTLTPTGAAGAPNLSPAQAQRLAAALLVPLRPGAERTLARYVLRSREEGDVDRETGTVEAS
ncbi:MAG: type I-U CRISPR-associated protein Csx17 [Firmicutes bacterium]|nr:type I-U CRISPR-associated protein Csx17 [Bacillota bacterium]